ncbi:MAG: glycosyltransferase family 4 protein [Verrucomicrobia bacterium]|nr:glycosyltransferase family 4 protein [Verrucomicrobiota bacterium]
MRLLFVNRFYWPEHPATGQLLTDLAEGLAARGWSVTVVTSAAPAGVAAQEVRRGVQIVRVAGTRWARHGAFAKGIDFLTFYLRALLRVFRLARPGEIVVAMTDPPLLGVGLAAVAALRRTHLVHWVQDIYPEIAVELFGRRWLRVLEPLRNLAWRRADLCVTLGTDMAQLLARAAVRPERTAIIPNWAPVGVEVAPAEAGERLRREWHLQGRFVIAYSGNLGRVHDLEPVLALAAALQADPRIAMVLIGDGAQRAPLEAIARRERLTNVSFFPPQPRDALAATLAAGDVHLVTLRPGCEPLVFPSKLYGVAAAGRPVLFIGPPDSEIAGIVTDRGLGRAFAREAIADLAAAVRAWVDNPALVAAHAAAARQFAVEHHADQAIARWDTQLQAIAGSPARPAPPSTAAEV